MLSTGREGTGNPLQYSCLENPRDGGAWWAAIHGVAQSRTRLMQLSSSSSSSCQHVGTGETGPGLLTFLSALPSVPVLAILAIFAWKAHSSHHSWGPWGSWGAGWTLGARHAADELRGALLEVSAGEGSQQWVGRTRKGTGQEHPGDHGGHLREGRELWVGESSHGAGWRSVVQRRRGHLLLPLSHITSK